MTLTEKDISADELQRIRDAVAMIGGFADGKSTGLSVAEHSKALDGRAAALGRILDTPNDIIRRTLGEHCKYETSAKRWRRVFEASVGVLSFLIIAVLTLVFFLITVPPEMEWPVRSVLSGATGLGGLTLVSRGIALFGGPLRLAYAAPFAVVPASYFWVVPNDFSTLKTPMLVVLVLVFFGCLLLGDFVSGGVTATLLRHLTRWLPKVARHRGIGFREAWYEARGKAEARRRLLFMDVFGADAGQVAPEASESGVPLLSQQLEYARRFLIEDQLAYYGSAGQRARNGAWWAQLARVGAFVMVTVLFAVVGATFIAKSSEQGMGGVQDWLPDRLLGTMIAFVRRGGEDAALLAAIVALGIFCYLQMNSVLLREQANSRRYKNTAARVRQATSQRPEIVDPYDQSPLMEARKAAIRGDRQKVEGFLRDVNRVMAAEVSDWDESSRYSLEIKDNLARVISSDRLTYDDFDQIATSLDGKLRARKVGFVAAVKADKEQRIETRFNGTESTNTAHPGDWIVTNMDRNRGLLVDQQGNVDTYVITATKFPTLYERDTGANVHGDIYRPKSVVDAVRLPGGFDIVAPWGERQQRSSGYLLRNRDDVYGIAKEAFDRTYEILKPDA